MAEYDGSNNLLRRYVHGPAEDDPLLWYEGSGLSDRRALQGDWHGSIVSVADAGGNLIAIDSYDEYGIPGANNLGRFQYTGQAWLPELGMYYYKARIYSPTLGRFLQTDPIGYKDQINLYAYVGNDPVNRSDPTGLAGCSSDMSSGDCNAALKAQAQARQDIKNTQSALTGLSKERAAVANGSQKELSGGAKATEAALQKQFGDSGTSTIKSVQSSLSAIDKVLADDGSKYQFEHRSIPGDLGKAWPSGSKITLGDAFFRASARDQIVTVLHEPGHIANWAGDFGYEGRSKNLPTWLRLNNADDVAIFGYNAGSR